MAVDDRLKAQLGEVVRQRELLREELGSLKDGGGGGTSGGMTDDALKPRVDFLQTAFLWLAGIMVTAIVAIIGVVLALSSAANVRTDKLTETTAALSREVGVSNAKLDEANRRLDRIERKIDAIGR